MRKECISCAYYQIEEMEEGYICVNEHKRLVNSNDSCGFWEQSSLNKYISQLNKRKDNLLFVINSYGVRSQEDVSIEEMAELQKAIIKNRRYNDKSTKEEVIEEIADVEIMLAQLKIIYSCKEEVEKKIDYKIEREIKRILDKYGVKND